MNNLEANVVYNNSLTRFMTSSMPTQFYFHYFRKIKIESNSTNVREVAQIAPAEALLRGSPHSETGSTGIGEPSAEANAVR